MTSSPCRIALQGLMVLALVNAVGCSGNAPDAPAAPPTRQADRATTFTLTGCVDCLMAGSYTSLAKALADPDSVSNLPIIATSVIAGHAGDSVMVHFSADDSLLAALPAAEALVIEGGEPDSVSLGALVTPRAVYRFRGDETITLRYRFSRNLSRVPGGAFHLTQSSSGAVESFSATDVVSEPTVGLMAADTGNPACGRALPLSTNGQYCGVNVHVIPSIPAAAFQSEGARFQNAVFTGQSGPVDISFSKPVARVEVTFYDPTFDGNTFEARDSTDARINFVAVPGNGRPGVLTIQTASAQGPISSVHLRAPLGDYVAYSMRVQFTPTACKVSNLTTFGQAEPAWSRLQYDTKNNIGQRGCAMTAVAMGLSVFGTAIDPGALNALMNSHDGFDADGNVFWKELVGIPSRGALVFERLSSMDDLKGAICKGWPALIGVKVRGTTPHHFVLATGINPDGSVQIQDPANGSGVSRPLTFYSPPYQVRGVIRPKAQGGGSPDRSSVTSGVLQSRDIARNVVAADDPPSTDLAIYAAARIEVTDAGGARTVVDDTTFIAGIPGSQVARDAIDDDAAPFAPDTVGHAFVNLPLAGSYEVVITPSRSDSLKVTMLATTATDLLISYSRTLSVTAGRALAFDVTATPAGATARPLAKGYVSVNRSCGRSHTVTNANALPLDLMYGMEGSNETGTLHIDASSSAKLKTDGHGRILLYQDGQLVYRANVPLGCS